MKTTEDDLGEQIVRAAGRAQAALELLNVAVRNGRRAEMTWEDIGRLLGVSRQAAQQRFGRTAGDESPADDQTSVADA